MVLFLRQCEKSGINSLLVENDVGKVRRTYSVSNLPAIASGLFLTRQNVFAMKAQSYLVLKGLHLQKIAKNYFPLYHLMRTEALGLSRLHKL